MISTKGDPDSDATERAMSVHVPCIKVKANIDPIQPARCHRKTIFIQVVIVLCMCKSLWVHFLTLEEEKTSEKLTDMTDERFQAIIPTPPLQKTY